MTLEIALVLGILAAAVVLFVTEWVRVDLVALIVLVSLAFTGLITPVQAISGFSNPAVITVWAVFILSGGLARTGVAGMLGRQVLRLAGDSESRLIMVIMLTAASLSAFMNNVGVAALLLPVVMDISRQTRRPPSKLLIPLAFSSLLGGLMTLIGTPPNILVTASLEEHGLEPFRFFDFTPVGIAVVIAGIAYMSLVGRKILPSRNPARELAGGRGRPGSGLQSQGRSVRARCAGRVAAGREEPGREPRRVGPRPQRDGSHAARPDSSWLRTLPFVFEPGDRIVVQGQQDATGGARGARVP